MVDMFENCGMNSMVVSWLDRHTLPPSYATWSRWSRTRSELVPGTLCKRKTFRAQIREFFLLALGHVIANGAGNFAFGPEIYRTKPKPDYDVLGHFVRHAGTMVAELATVQERGMDVAASHIHAADARELADIPGGLTAVITSPPYPNEKDYTRTTRVESILLRLVRACLENIGGGVWVPPLGGSGAPPPKPPKGGLRTAANGTVRGWVSSG